MWQNYWFLEPITTRYYPDLLFAFLILISIFLSILFHPVSHLHGKNTTLPGASTEEKVILYKNPEPLDVQKNEEEQGDGTERRHQVYEDDPIFNFSWPSGYQTVVSISVIFVIAMIVCAAFVIKNIVKNTPLDIMDIVDNFRG